MTSFEYHKDRRIALYPEYLDSSLTLQEGRRVPKHIACEHPTVKEMADCCAHLKLRAEVEDKMFPRSCTRNGRIRVELKDADGNLVHDHISNKKKLMQEICLLIPKHAGRQGRPDQQKNAGGAGASKSRSKGRRK